MSQKHVYLDFDGVIVDSCWECWQVTCAAIKYTDLNLDFSDTPSFTLFKRYRYLVKPPYQYFLLYKLLATPDIIHNSSCIEPTFLHLDTLLSDKSKKRSYTHFFQYEK